MRQSGTGAGNRAGGKSRHPAGHTNGGGSASLNGPDNEQTAVIIRKRALDLLAQREHSGQELRAKLLARGFAPEAVREVLAGLRSAGLQDDMRYAEAYLRSRIAKGYGPLRVTRELCERGLSEELAQQALAAMEPDWQDRIRSVRQKKFGRQAPGDFREQARQSRFLQYRGFTSEQIRREFNSGQDEAYRSK